jgi:hypothetical protein
MIKDKQVDQFTKEILEEVQPAGAASMHVALGMMYRKAFIAGRDAGIVDTSHTWSCQLEDLIDEMKS